MQLYFIIAHIFGAIAILCVFLAIACCVGLLFKSQPKGSPYSTEQDWKESLGRYRSDLYISFTMVGVASLLAIALSLLCGVCCWAGDRLEKKTSPFSVLFNDTQ